MSMSRATKLIFFCGKMAAGKSTLAGELADREEAVLLMQDEFLDALLPGEHASVEHESHFVAAPDDLCKGQLRRDC